MLPTMTRFQRSRYVAALTIWSLIFIGSLLANDVQVLIGSKEPNPKDVEPGELNSPFAAEVDGEGRWWMVEFEGGRLMRWNPTTGLTFIAGNGQRGHQDGSGAEVQFNQLHNLAIADSGIIYLSDHKNHVVRQYDPKTGQVTSIAGTGVPGFGGDGGPASAAQFHEPISVALSPDQTTLYVADIRNRRIRGIDIGSMRVQTVAGNGHKGVPKDGRLAAESPLVDPRAVAVDGVGNLVIAERGGHALRVVRDGEIFTIAGTGKSGQTDGPADKATFNGPKHIDVGDDGRIYVADDNNDAIRIYDPKTKSVETLDLGTFRLKRPHGVTFNDGALTISDSFHHRILRVTFDR